MAGFLGSNVSMTICEVNEKKAVTPENLRKGAFTETIDPDGFRFGWTGQGDLLDVENFSLALSDGRFSGFSYRLDMKKPALAVARLQLAEKIRAEEANGGKIGRARKRELREAVVEALLSQTDFSPELIDCLWDQEKGQLFIASTSEKRVERILAHFKACFGMEAFPIGPEKDMGTVFSAIQGAGGLELDGFFLEPQGSATLRSQPGSEEKCSISVRNNGDAVNEALASGLIIKKMGFIVRENGIDDEFFFSLSDDLLVSGLAFPKNTEENDIDATFLLHAEICAKTATIVRSLASE